MPGALNLTARKRAEATKRPRRNRSRIHKKTAEETKEMFKKILIANRSARAEGAVAQATNCVMLGAAGHAGEFTPGTWHV